MSRPLRPQHSSSDSIPLPTARSDQEETALEADIMILDHLAYCGTKACLKNREILSSENSTPLGLALTAYQDFLTIFKARHALYRPDDDLRLRILLLKFSTLVTQRLAQTPSTPSAHDLANLRSENKLRARNWIDSRYRVPSLPFDNDVFLHELPISRHHLVINRATVLRELDFPAEDPKQAFYGTSSCVALLDLLPLFMKISALRNSMNGGALNDRWMALACEFMLQSCLEHYLIIGSNGTDAIDEAFSWGYKPSLNEPRGENSALQQNHETDELNEMFEDEDYATEIEGWKDVRLSYLMRLSFVDDSKINAHTDPTSRSAIGLASHFQNLAGELPMISFEENLLAYITGLVDSISQPILSQLERGNLDDMNEEQTRSFLNSCGIRS